MIIILINITLYSRIKYNEIFISKITRIYTKLLDSYQNSCLSCGPIIGINLDSQKTLEDNSSNNSILSFNFDKFILNLPEYINNTYIGKQVLFYVALIVLFSFLYFYSIRHNIKTIFNFSSIIKENAQLNKNIFLKILTILLIISTTIFHMHVSLRLMTVLIKIINMRASNSDYPILGINDNNIGDILINLILFFISYAFIMNIIKIITDKLKHNI